ncbi:MAG: HEAT repeat domain-containing protein [Gammaproteobacteria bacterium]|nr:HEAT repeat domain-containing protein [Gammaproteobacteria bacterium]
MNMATAKPDLNDKQNAVRAISKWLKQGDELDRCCACRSLGVLGDQHSVATLVNHLHDDDIDVCIDAAEALGHIGDTRAVAPLLEVLHHNPENDVKTVVVEVLGQLGDNQAISKLLELATSPLKDSEWDDDDTWDSNWDIQIKAVKALGHLRARAAVKPLSNLLNNDECQVEQSDLFNTLARIGDAGEQVLIEHLQQDIPRQRRRAARALGLACSTKGSRALGRALQDPQPDVRAAAANALANGHHIRYLNALLLLLRDPCDDVREAALKAINKLTTENNTVMQCESFSEKPGENVNDTVEQYIGHTAELKKCLVLLDDNSPQVRTAVLNILHGHLDNILSDVLSDHIQPRLQGLLENPNPSVAAAACPFAVILNDQRTEQTLLSLTINPQADPTVRQQAILALGQCGNATEPVLKALTEVLNAQDNVILLAALQALLALHLQGMPYINKYSNKKSDKSSSDNNTDKTHPTPLKIILAALRGEIIDPVKIKPKNTESTHLESASQIEKHNAGGITNNVDETDNPDKSNPTPPCSTLDAIALANIKSDRQEEADNTLHTNQRPGLSPKEMAIFQPYYDILEQQQYNHKKFSHKKIVNPASEVRRLSARILGECHQPDVINALAQTIHDENPEVQREAINALARMTPNALGIAKTIGPLISFLHIGNIDLRIASAKALGALGNMETLPSLLNCLEDNNLLVRNQATLAVGQQLKRYSEQTLTIPKPQHVANKNTEENINQFSKTVEQYLEYAFRGLSGRLNDADIGVRKAAVLTITEHSALLLSTEKLHGVSTQQQPPNQLRNEIIEHLINAGFAIEGQQARDIGIALRAVDPAMASNCLISLLDNLPSSLERRFAMEMLEEIFRPHQEA